MRFEDLGLHRSILDGIEDAGYENPTEIQEHAIPLVLDGQDLIGLGQTGSGKTAAFGLPILNQLVDGEPGLRALILVPTRELCVQVAENLRVYAAHTGLHVCTAFGGIDMGIQESAYKRGLDVMVACPGRLIDHLERRNITVEQVKTVVLDEADRMLDMGFMPQIRRIFIRLPEGERQNLLFSATMPPEVEALVKDFMGHAERVQIGQRSQAPSTIRHRFLAVRSSDKIRILERILAQEKGKVLIFVKRKSEAETLGRILRSKRLPADSIHGDKSAESRHVVLQAFTRGRVQQLVATDVAARGIDVDDIDLVIHFDMPMAVEDYIHRSGRTGRVGRAGRALSLVTPSDRRIHGDIVKHLKNPNPDGTTGGEKRYGTPGRGGGGGRSGGRSGGGGGRGRRPKARQ